MTYSTILLLIVAIFIICHVPRVALNIYEVFDYEQISACGPPLWSVIFQIFSNGILPALNSAINFFIYFLAGRKFRNSLMNLLLCRDETPINVVSKTSFRTADTKLAIGTDEAARKVKEVIEMKKKCESMSKVWRTIWNIDACDVIDRYLALISDNEIIESVHFCYKIYNSSMPKSEIHELTLILLNKHVTCNMTIVEKTV